MGWKRLARHVVASDGDQVAEFSFAACDYLKVVVWINKQGTGDFTLYPNAVTSGGNSFTARYAKDFANTSANTDHIGIHGNYGQLEGDCHAVYYISNKDGEEKLIQWTYALGASGNNAPDSFEATGKYTTKTGQITSLSGNIGSGGFGAGSTITVYGKADSTITDEKTTISNIPVNTRYEETDTRKIYRFDESALSPSFHYKFSEASGDVINHGSVANADLTVTSLTRDQSTPSGLGNGMKTTAYNTGYAQNTSRVNDYKFLHDGTSKWSITFWLKAGDTPTDSTSTERMVFGNIWTDDNGIGFCIRLAKNSDNSSSVCRIQTLIADGDSGMPLNDQTPDGMMPDVSNWHFYCITYDPTLSSNNLTVSRDATTSGTGFHQGDYDDVAYSTSNPTRKTTYFARPTSSYDHGIVGTLAQVMIFKDVILTQANKESLYASGNGTTTIPTATSWKERGTA